LRQFDLIAAFCAALGACAKAGVASASAKANVGHSVVLVIWIIEANPYRYRRKPPLVASGEDQEKPNRKIPGAGIFSRFRVPSQANYG
jgi:hypothetical protein